MTTLTHTYKGYAISQDNDGYTCLTDMAKAVGKQVNDYLRLSSTNEYLQALGLETQIPVSSLIRIVQGKGKVQGTWAHPEVAIDFASWCNVNFRIWANRTLRGVIEGNVVPQPHPDRSIDSRKIDLQISIKKLEIEIAKLEIARVDLDYQSVPTTQPKTSPIQQELDLDIVERYKASEAALLKAKTIANEYKALSITPKPKNDLTSIDNIESVQAYIRDRTKLDPSAKVYIGKADGNPATHFYPNYINYCVEQGLAFVTMQAFSKVLMQLVYTNMEVRLFKGKDAKGCHVKGIAIAA